MTRYDVDDDSQVHVPANAAARRGIQPVVDLTVEGPGTGSRSPLARPSPSGPIQVPPDAGEIVATEWDFTGTGDFHGVALRSAGAAVHVRQRSPTPNPAYDLAAPRATAQRDGDPSTRFARVQNLDLVVVDQQCSTRPTTSSSLKRCTERRRAGPLWPLRSCRSPSPFGRAAPPMPAFASAVSMA